MYHVSVQGVVERMINVHYYHKPRNHATFSTFSGMKLNETQRTRAVVAFVKSLSELSLTSLFVDLFLLLRYEKPSSALSFSI